MIEEVDSREVGLVAGLHLVHFFHGNRDLHYGLWEDDIELCVLQYKPTCCTKAPLTLENPININTPDRSRSKAMHGGFSRISLPSYNLEASHVLVG